MTDHDAGTILIAYDGSDAARNAIAQAGLVFPRGRAVVATVWRSLAEAAGVARAAMPDAIITEAVDQLNAAAEGEAARVAEEGCELARAAGLDASPRTLGADGSVWTALVRFAHDTEPRAVVVGSRGRSALRSAVLGGVSNAVVHHCRRPVLVVHPADEP
ncbi:MAG: universal stress protein [Solirubrobacterales bacterium]|nr:universal stress protein [Solirubrobacterales bacterium]